MGAVEKAMTARLSRSIDEVECKRRNALSRHRPGYELQPGQVGTILETLEEGSAFLIEFGQDDSDACDWLGVLYASEIEVHSTAAAT